MEERPEKLCGDDWEAPRSKSGLRLLGDLAAVVGLPGWRWHYPVLDESRRSFAGHAPAAMPVARCRHYFALVRDSTQWKQPEGSKGKIPRKTSWMVNGGCTCTYLYGGIEVVPQVFPQWMTELMHECMPLCGLPEVNQWPNSCNLNLYEDGGMSVGWHSDDEQIFQGRFQDCQIISLSLGVSRKFELRLNWPDADDKALRKFLLSEGDLLTMEGMMQKHFQHRVPREESVTGPRINLTWRWVARHDVRCPVGRCRP